MKHIGVASWFNRLCNAQSDFVSKERIIWVDIEGVPLHAWSRNTFYKIRSKWGEVLELEESKELFVWSPTFKDVPEVVYCSDDEFITGVDVNNAEINKQTTLEAESDNEAVSETYFGEHADELGNENDSVQPYNEKEISNDLFNIYDLLKRELRTVGISGMDSGAFRTLQGCSDVILKDAQKIDEHFSTKVRGNGVKHKEGGSILEILDEMIKVGQTMGFSMDGCTKDMEKIIRSQGAHEVFR
ncbi:RNA-directed DNA polymerase, eukaryota [Tanacetum coccineum]